MKTKVLLIGLIVLLFYLIIPITLHAFDKKDAANLCIQIVVALITTLAVVVALFKHRLTNWLNQVDLAIIEAPQRDNFTNTTPNGKQYYTIHLYVRNLTPTKQVRNCRVWLKRCYIQKATGEIQMRTTFGAMRLTNWAPREADEKLKDFYDGQVFDFGSFFVDSKPDRDIEDGTAFLFQQEQKGQWPVKHTVGMIVFYVFKITADNYAQNREFTVKVAIEPNSKRSIENPHENCFQMQVV